MTQTYMFARNVDRHYYDVPAESEEAALALLKANEHEYYSGRRATDEEDEEPFELIDIEYDDEDEPEVPEDTPSLDTSFHDHEMDI